MPAVKGQWYLSTAPGVKVKLVQCLTSSSEEFAWRLNSFPPSLPTSRGAHWLEQVSHAWHPKTVAVWPTHVLIFMALYWHRFDSKTNTNCAKCGIQWVVKHPYISVHRKIYKWKQRRYVTYTVRPNLASCFRFWMANFRASDAWVAVYKACTVTGSGRKTVLK